MHLRQSRFTYGACGTCAENSKKECKTLKKHDIHNIFFKRN